ncbi:SIMPL domain-containing protein [Brevibacillus dissolubilis]|uniref:SIMPL domain-containing protein n=1 Tax=Brevibacillus dissolubilis TaxID=1844116 RepID=UPI001116674C|nr:SIMPL domain-containing protein [Brevibacillus dissolubilis]
MKKNWLLYPALTAILLFTGTPINDGLGVQTAHAAQEQIVHQINVNGTGSVSITPDVVYVQFGVQTTEKTATEAHQKNAAEFAKVKAALNKAGIADKDIQTVQFSTYPQYSYSDKDGQKITGYTVQNIVRVTYRDIPKVGQFLDTLSQAGVNRVDSLDFGTEKAAAYQSQALERALADARIKADALAKAAGVKIKGIISMTESGAVQPAVPMLLRAKSEAAADAPTQISPGELKIQANISVSYEF